MPKGVYERTVSELNIVRFMKRLRYLKPKKGQEFGCILWTGGLTYGYGAFWDNESKKQIHAHRWIYKYLVNPDLPDDIVVRHTCDRRRCCNIAHHLEGSQADNMRDMVERGRSAKGKKHRAYLYPESIARGDKHGSKTHPERVARGERSGRYTHPENTPRGEKSGKSKLTESDVFKIRKLYKTGSYSLRELAEKFSVGYSTVDNVVKRQTWTHI